MKQPGAAKRRKPERIALSRARIVILFIIAAILVLVAIGYRNATARPIVRVVRIETPELTGSQPVRILFLSDTHVQGPDMPPARLAQIVRQLNGLHPDLVLLGGDYTGEKLIATHNYSLEDAVRPFREFHPRLGVVGVIGNHDRDNAPGVRDALSAVGVRLLEDEAIQLGPVAVGGILQRGREVARELDKLSGPKLIVTHRPDPIVRVPPEVTLTLAGHTHCGQIVLPFIGPLATGSELPVRYSCGLRRYGTNLLVVTAGLGTSQVPVRFGAPPDVWLITLLPEPAQARPL